MRSLCASIGNVMVVSDQSCGRFVTAMDIRLEKVKTEENAGLACIEKKAYALATSIAEPPNPVR